MLTTQDDATMRDLVARLSRPGPNGRRVIEHAAIVAEGDGAASILTWLADASWVPEERAPAGADAGTGLHGRRGASSPRATRRYVSPPS